MTDGGLRLVILDERRVVREVLEERLVELGCHVVVSAAPAARDVPSLDLPSDIVIASGEASGTSILSLEEVDLHDAAEVWEKITSVTGPSSVFGPHAVGDECGAVADPLTPRERSVLVRIAEGLTAAQIAADLDVSERSVLHAKRRILKKFGVSSQAEAVGADRRRALSASAG